MIEVGVKKMNRAKELRIKVGGRKGQTDHCMPAALD